MKVLIIIPAYNEELNIVKTVNDVTSNTNYDYVIINDGSKDKTLGKRGVNSKRDFF